MLLIGQAPLPAGATLRFSVIAGGEPMVRGEGTVVEHVAAAPGRPGGLRIRFKRLDARSKALVDRCIAFTKLAEGAKLAPGDPDVEARVSFASLADLESAPAAGFPPVAAAPAEADAPSPKPASAPPGANGAGAGEPERGSDPGVPASETRAVERVEQSGVRHRPRPIDAPGNRDELLARLRSRARDADKPKSDAETG
jgi:hypothetical protein